MAFLDELEDALTRLHQVVLDYGDDDDVTGTDQGFTSISVAAKRNNLYVTFHGAFSADAMGVTGRSDQQLVVAHAGEITPVVKEIIKARLRWLADAEERLRNEAVCKTKRADRCAKHHKRVRALDPSALEALAKEAE